MKALSNYVGFVQLPALQYPSVWHHLILVIIDNPLSCSQSRQWTGLSSWSCSHLWLHCQPVGGDGPSGVVTNSCYGPYSRIKLVVGLNLWGCFIIRTVLPMVNHSGYFPSIIISFFLLVYVDYIRISSFLRLFCGCLLVMFPGSISGILLLCTLKFTNLWVFGSCFLPMLVCNSDSWVNSLDVAFFCLQWRVSVHPPSQCWILPSMSCGQVSSWSLLLMMIHQYIIGCQVFTFSSRLSEIT